MSDNHFDNPELNGIFDHLKPEDFLVEGPNQGKEAFDKFFESCLTTVRTAFAASDGHLNPIAILSDTHREVSYTPGDETLDEWMAHLRSEAHKIGATWFFVCRKTMVGFYQATTDDEIPDIADPAALQKAIESGQYGEGMFFYAERLEPGGTQGRHGLMRIDGNTLGDLVEGSSQAQSADYFKGVLG